MPFLSELYYAGISPMYDTGEPKDAGYIDAEMEVKISEKALRKELTEEQAALFEKYINARARVDYMQRAAAFAYAMSFGVRLTSEAFTDTAKRFC